MFKPSPHSLPGAAAVGRSGGRRPPKGWVLAKRDDGVILVRSAGYEDLERVAVRADSRHDSWRRPSVADIRRGVAVDGEGAAAGPAPNELNG